MLSKARKRYEEIFENFFQESFGKDSKVLVNWGYPIMTVSIDFNNEDLESSLKIIFNIEDGNFNINSKAARKVDDSWIPEVSAIDKNTIDFIIQNSKKINEQLFYTSGIVQQEEEEKEVEETSAKPAESEKEEVEE